MLPENHVVFYGKLNNMDVFANIELAPTNTLEQFSYYETTDRDFYDFISQETYLQLYGFIFLNFDLILQKFSVYQRRAIQTCF